MQKFGKILRGRKDTHAPVVSTLRGRAGERPRRPRRSDASATIISTPAHSPFDDAIGRRSLIAAREVWKSSERN